MGTQNKSVEEQRDKLYGQFINRLLILLWTGFSAGGCLLAALDYVLVQQIPERHPVILGLFLLSGIVCLVYWLTTFFKAKGIEGVRGLAVFGLIIAFIATSAGSYGMWKNTENLRTYFQGERIVMKDKMATAEILQGYIETWRHTPNYSMMWIAEDAYYATVYNSKGESVTQFVMESEDAGHVDDMAITLSDGTSVIVTADTIEKRKDVDNLTYVSRALQWVLDGNKSAELGRVNMSAESSVDASSVPNDGFPGTEYAVTITGSKALEKFFSEVIGEKEAAEMFTAFVGVEVSMVYSIVLDVGYIGVSSAIYVGGELSVLWYVDNYIEVYDWELGTEDWYGYDFTDSDKNEQLLEAATYNVTTMLNKFSHDIGMDISTEFEYNGSDEDDTKDNENLQDDGAGNVVYSSDDGKTVWMSLDGDFVARLTDGVEYAGTYEIVDDSVVYFYYGEAEAGLGVISNDWLELPANWIDDPELSPRLNRTQ